MTDLKNENFAVFTVCNLAYLPKALALAESVLKHNNQKLKIYLVEKKRDIDLSNLPAEFVWIEDVGVPDFYQLAFKYDIIEFSTCVKPFITLKLLEKVSKVVFLDPDTFMFDSLAPILADLDKHSIVLTPHYTTPQTDHLDESDLGMMRFGSFNLGFYAVKNSEQTKNFLNWWFRRCVTYCFMESQFGLSTDQKWVTIAPCFFDDIFVSFDLGLNVSAWNSFERKITKNENGKYFVNNKFPLVFFHFSNFNRNDLDYSLKRSHYEKGVKRPDFQELCEIYLTVTDKYTNALSKTKYGFDYMSDGSYISPTLRRAYACVLPELPKNHDPFDANGVVGKFARKNYLTADEMPYKTQGYADLANSKFQLKIIYFGMRLVLRIIGPNRFQNFARLLVYLSSYRQNRGLWKL